MSRKEEKFGLCCEIYSQLQVITGCCTHPATCLRISPNCRALGGGWRLMGCSLRATAPKESLPLSFPATLTMRAALPAASSRCCESPRGGPAGWRGLLACGGSAPENAPRAMLALLQRDLPIRRRGGEMDRKLKSKHLPLPSFRQARAGLGGRPGPVFCPHTGSEAVSAPQNETRSCERVLAMAAPAGIHRGAGGGSWLGVRPCEGNIKSDPWGGGGEASAEGNKSAPRTGTKKELCSFQ